MMKRIIYLLLSVFIIASVSTLAANAGEKSKTTQNDRRVELRKKFDAKTSKSATKRAKELVKAGWKPIGGGKPIEVQLERAWQYEEPNEDGEVEYIVESGVGIARTKDVAINIAKREAALAIAKSLEIEVSALSDGLIANRALSEEEVYTKADMSEVNKTFVSKKLKKMILLSQWYRTTENNNIEVESTWAIKISTIKEELKEAWLKEVNVKRNELNEELLERLKESGNK